MGSEGLPREIRPRSAASSSVARQHLATRRAPAITAAPIPELLRGTDWLRLSEAMGLSGRESDLVREVFYDEHVESIATNLGLSKHTVRTYRDRLFRKLGVTSCVQLVAAMFAVYVQINPNLDQIPNYTTADAAYNREGRRRDIR